MSTRRTSSDDALAALIAEHAMGNIPRLPERIARDIAEDVLSGLRKQGLQVRPKGAAGQRYVPPPPGTVCGGDCKRPLYTLTYIEHDRTRLPEGAAIHHARGHCNACDSRKTREKASTA